RAVTASPAPRPLLAGDTVEARREDVCRLDQLLRDDCGILFAVVVVERGLVLVPVRIRRIDLREPQDETPVVDPVDVPHVARVLERRPGVVGHALARVLSREHGRPRPRVLAYQATDFVVANTRRVEPTLRTRTLDHPRPVLGVGDDWHTG